MMLQVTAVALLSEAKVLAHPASIDNVPTDGGKEDHVSMGMTAATKLRSIVDLAEQVTAIELITAAEGLEYRAPLAPGRGVKTAYEIVRATCAATYGRSFDVGRHSERLSRRFMKVNSIRSGLTLMTYVRSTCVFAR